MTKKGKRQKAAPPDPERTTKYHGLRNQGATCYLNSVLQVLYMTKDFKEAVKGSNSSQDSHGCIDYRLHSVFNTLTKQIASTQEITNHLGIKKVNEQHDAAECFDKILSRSSPKASEIFQGVLTHQNTCSKCGEKTVSNSPFWSLPLTLSEIECYPVTDAVQKYFQESEICGENQLYCNNCKDKTDSSIKLEMNRHPDVLTLLLKRFKFDYHYMDYVKIKCSVQIPYTLKIPTTKNKTQHYQLYAYVEHSGELRSGHYTAQIKSEEDSQWYTFNDCTVSKNGYQRFQVDNEEKIPKAYLLFYKKTTDSLDADSCGESTPKCYKLDVETPQREEGEKTAAVIDNKEEEEDKTKNRGEIKPRTSVRNKHSEMAGTNDGRFISMNNCTEHRRLSEISIDDNLKLSPDIDGQSRDKPQNGSETTNDHQQNPETVQNKIEMLNKKIPNDKKRSEEVVDDHHTDCDKLYCTQNVSDNLGENSPKGFSYNQMETKTSDQRENEGKKPEVHCTETGAKHQILSSASTNEDGLNQEVMQEEQHNHSEVEEENPQNDKNFQARENYLQGDVQSNITSVTQKITVKIDTDPQNNSITNDGETSNCISMQKQKDLLEQQIQSDEKFSTGSENIENISESTNLTEPKTENITEVSPHIETQQNGRNRCGKNKKQRGKNKKTKQTIWYSM